MVIVWLLIAMIPIGISLWALLDCARRPAWAWSFAGRSQVAWLAAIAFGVMFLIFGMAISLWYLMRVRPAIAAVEAGDFRRLDTGLSNTGLQDGEVDDDPPSPNEPDS